MKPRPDWYRGSKNAPDCTEEGEPLVIFDVENHQVQNFVAGGRQELYDFLENEKLKKHYYSFSFIENNAGAIYASVYIGYPEKFVSIQQISDAKKSAGVSQEAVMLACCYLGHMTNKEVGYAQSEEK